MDLPWHQYVTFIDDKTLVEYDTREYGFVLDNDFTIEDAQARRYEQLVPGRDGTLDLTDALGGVHFENRLITLPFTFNNKSMERFHYESSRIRRLLDGRRIRALFSTDPGYYWVGRCQVGTELVFHGWMKLTVTIDAYPFKLALTSSYEPWRWDPFSFIDGTVTNPIDVVLNNQTKTVQLPKDPAAQKVILWLNKGDSGQVSAKLTTDNTWHLLRRGENTFPEITLSATEESTLQLKGTGTVGVEYRVGSL